jgi:5'-3' exonuclease
MCAALNTKDVELWLSGKHNFRYDIYPEYKANRINAKRPKWEHDIRNYLIEQWGANVSDGCEADDMLGVRMYQLDSPICCSIDKDLDQLAGDHYNFVKKEKYHVTNEEGLRFFYYQCLVGDTADGVKGVPNIGPIKAKKLLDACDAEAASSGASRERLYYDAVVERFSCYEEFLMTAQVLHIWKKPNDIWTDPFASRMVFG